MKKKLIIAISIISIIGIVVFIYNFYLVQYSFALDKPIVTEYGDKFNYTWDTEENGPFVGTIIIYTIYHHEDNRWHEIMQCRGGYKGDQEIKISSAYEDQKIIVYKVWQYIKEGTDNHYLIIDKSNSKATDLSSKLEDTCADMTKEQIRNDRLLNQAKAFILNYKLPEDTDYNHYEASFKKIRDAFQEK